MTYKDVQEYLRNYSLSEPPYDPNGALHLLIAIVENLEENLNESDFEDFSCAINEKNEIFLSNLLASIPRSRTLNKD